jgi:hypothetical protein
MKKLEGRNGGGPKAFSSSRYCEQCNRENKISLGRKLRRVKDGACLQGEDET